MMGAALVAAMILLSQSPARVSESGTARIAGRVTAADSGHPIRFADVNLIRWENGRGTQYFTGTDSRGEFEFVGLTTGSYQLTVEKEGYVAGEYGQRQTGAPGRRIDLKDRQNFQTADLTLSIARAIEGILLDAFGDPAPGILVQAARVDFIAGERRLIPIQTSQAKRVTDDRGHFRVFGLAPGDYFLLASSGVFAGEDRAGFPLTFYPGQTKPAFANPIHVDAGQDALGVNFALASSGLANLSGSVVDQGGNRLSQMPVTLFQLHNDDIRVYLPVSLTTSADGRFSFRNVPFGSYVLQTGSVGQQAFGFARVNVAADVKDQVLTVRGGSTARARVLFEGSHPPPLTQIRLIVVPVDFVSGPAGGGRPSQTTGDDGVVEATGFNSLGVVMALAPPPWITRRVTQGGVDVTDVPMDFRGRDHLDLEVTLTSATAAVSAVVENGDGARLADYSVVVFSSDPEKWKYPSRYIAMVRSGPDGTAEIAGLPGGLYRVVAVPRVSGTQSQDPGFLATLQNLGVSLTLVEGRTTPIRLIVK